MPNKVHPRGAHPYGRSYVRARAAILGPSGKGSLSADVACHWLGTPDASPRCTGIATTADHEPPLEQGGSHDRMVPSCEPCNYGRRLRKSPSTTYPGPSREW